MRVKIGNGVEQTIDADLVVDAIRARLVEPGLAGAARLTRGPTEERIEIGIGYTTRVYRRRPTDLGGKLAVVIAGSAPNWRNGVILAQSEDRWIVSIGGYLGDHAPTTSRCSRPTPPR